MTDSMAVVKVCNNIIEAQIIEGLLRGAGIPVMVSSDDCGRVHPAMQLIFGAEVHVPTSRLEEAQSLIATPAALAEDEDIVEPL